MHVQIWEALLCSTLGLGEWADRWPKQRSVWFGRYRIWAQRSECLLEMKVCQKLGVWPVHTFCNLSGTLVLPPARIREKQRPRPMWCVSPVIIGPALSPTGPLWERTFAIAGFHSDRKDAAAFTGDPREFQSKGFKLNVSGDKALSVSKCTLSLVGCSQSPGSKDSGFSYQKRLCSPLTL